MRVTSSTKNVKKASMKSAAVQRKNFKIAKNLLSVIAKQIRGQAQLDTMLMRYDEKKRKVIFRHMRPFLQFDAIMPTEENTAVVTPESFAKLKEKYATSGD